MSLIWDCVPLRSRVVDDLKFLSFLESEIVFSSGVVIIESDEERDPASCGHTQTHNGHTTDITITVPASTFSISFSGHVNYKHVARVQWGTEFQRFDVDAIINIQIQIG